MAPPLQFSVVIATYNRRQRLARAIDSLLHQTWPNTEIIIVDDASPDDTQQFVAQTYPQVRCLRQHVNQGPGPARQRGIQEARNSWVVMLDDDDVLHRDGLETIANVIDGWAAAGQYPVLFFRHGNARVDAPFQVLDFPTYLSGAFAGDMLPVYQRSLYLKAGLSYPATRLGGEHLLFWRVALDFGIPAWQHCVGSVGTDAEGRLTSVRQQLQRAAEHAELQEQTLAQFGAVLQQQQNPAELTRRRLGAATYWLLAGRRRAAWPHVRQLLSAGHRAKALLIILIASLPTAALRWLFQRYRRLTSPNTCPPPLRTPTPGALPTEEPSGRGGV